MKRTVLNLNGASKIDLTGEDVIFGECPENVRLVADGKIGTLRIGYTDIAIAGVLPGLLQAFQVSEPDVTIKPHHGVTSGQLEKLSLGLLDVGFVTGPINLPGYDQLHIQSDRFVCIVHDNHRLADASSIALADLQDEDFVHGPLHEWHHFYSVLFPLCRKAGFNPRIVQEAYNTAGIMGLVASGMGITVLTENPNLTIAAGLRQIPIQGISEHVSTVALWRRDLTSGPCERFVSFLKSGNVSQVLKGAGQLRRTPSC